MKFGMFYLHQVPKPWDAESDRRMYNEALDQVELADKLGFDAIWQVEHHFQEEYSHGPAPEVFLAACSQRTKNIRLGHGIMLMPPKYNHPVRAAERIAVLDLISGGRVDWGTGASSTALELGGFCIDSDDKYAMWREATEQAANMLAMTPYPGFKGQFFEMPCRDIVPKAYQKPHPPVWLASSQRATILNSARNGLGSLVMAFYEPEQAEKWVREYYGVIKSAECVPLTHSINANMALLAGMSCHPDERVAIERGIEGFRFFGYSLGFYTAFGKHQPGQTDLWQRFEEVKHELPDNAGRGCMGTPEQIRQRLQGYEQAGVDQMIFVMQVGRNRHEHVCESIELFAREVMPEFKERDAGHVARKNKELAPFVEAALARKPRMTPLGIEDIPYVEGKASKHVTTADRGSAIPMVLEDPKVKQPVPAVG